MTADPNSQYLKTLATRIRNWSAPPADTNGSATDPTWQLVDLMVEYMKRTPIVDIMALLIARPDLKKHNLYGSPITLAAEHDLHHLIKPLHAAGIEVNITGKEGMTALEHAISQGSEQTSANTINALLDIGATMADEGSMLQYAAYCGHPHNVEALLKRGHNPNAPCPVSGQTPLCSAIWQLSSGPHIARTVKLLLEHGADPNQPQTSAATATNQTPKDTNLPINALVKTDTSDMTDGEIGEILDLMLEKGLKIDHDRHDLHHPLAMCLRNSNDKLAYALLQRGANPEHVNCFYRDGFTQAAIDELTEGGTKPLITISPFQQFAQHEMPRTVAYMIEHHHEDPEQTLHDSTPVIKTVFDPETLKVFRSAITQKQIADAIGNPDDNHAPRKPRSCFTL